MSHPAVPRVGLAAESASWLYLSQVFAEGELLSQSPRRTEREVVELARALLDACCALHQLSPRLAHGGILARQVVLGAAGTSPALVGVASASLCPEPPGIPSPAQHEDLAAVGRVLALLLIPTLPDGPDLARAFLASAASEGISSVTRQVVSRLLSRDQVSRFRDAAVALGALTEAHRAPSRAPSRVIAQAVSELEVPGEPVSRSRVVTAWPFVLGAAVLVTVVAVWGVGRLITAAGHSELRLRGEVERPASVARPDPPHVASPDRWDELERAEGAFRRGELEVAARVAGAILSGPSSPQSERARFIQARALHLLNRPDALDATSRYLDDHPKGPGRGELLRQRGEIRLAAGQEREAIGDFDAWLKEHPRDPESSTLLVLRARARIAAGDTEGAKGDLTDALAAVEPGSPNAYVAKRMLDELNAKK